MRVTVDSLATDTQALRRRLTSTRTVFMMVIYVVSFLVCRYRDVGT